MDFIILACLCSFGLIMAIVVPIFLIRKGIDLVFGCLSNGFVLIIAGVLLALYIALAEVNICQIWWVGEPLCSILNNF